MLQGKPNPRRDTLRFRTDRTASDFNSMRCPSPAGREAAASAAIPVGEGKIGNSSRFSIFAICSPWQSGYAKLRGTSNLQVSLPPSFVVGSKPKLSALDAQRHFAFRAQGDRRPCRQLLVGNLRGKGKLPMPSHEGQDQHALHPRQTFSNALPDTAPKREIAVARA